MTLRNSFRRLPPFQLPARARVDQLVCGPRSYVRATQADGRDLYAPMLAWSAGPLAIGETGDNSFASLTGGNWLLQVCPDGSWVLYRETGGQLEVIPWDDAPDAVSATARHPSLAFDQSARVALAWEDLGVIKVRRWDPVGNQYIENVSCAGVDPVVVLDATWSLSVRGSDVLLFYLSTDRERLYCRVQRDVYAIPYLLWDFGAASVLDGVRALPWRYEVLVSDGFGVVRDPLLVSSLYPFRAALRLAGDGRVSTAAYALVAQELRHVLAVEGDGVINSAAYHLAVHQVMHALAVEGDGVIDSAAYRLVVQQVVHALAVDGDGVIHAGAYVGPAVTITHSLAVDGDGQIIGGTYVIA